MIPNESEITGLVWAIINQVSGIPLSEIKNDTKIDSHDLKTIKQELGTRLSIPVHGGEFRNIDTAGELTDAAIGKVGTAGNCQPA